MAKDKPKLDEDDDAMPPLEEIQGEPNPDRFGGTADDLIVDGEILSKKKKPGEKDE